MPEKSIDALTSQFRPLACELLARLIEKDVLVMIICTRRTVDEQQMALLSGNSGTVLSSHLPRRTRWKNTIEFPSSEEDMGKSDAMDICPYEEYHLHKSKKLQWNSKNPAFGIIGEEAEKLGLRWGGRWHQPFDPGHVELALPWKQALMVAERKRPWPDFRQA